ncbi:TadG family pilus assembly protein [Methylobacterium sp. 391_Methyba4]|uniref:TadG family pilus assembly protein n=1 Tax=Methylobacterium sp. 391_Methyba4 TaxID=3038924 RepID=UPI00241DC256|nr:TadG family pilus assembly protein [Methylobacterium sp. 391_Methyba4]WFS10225.1 TadG family pilus assembly protein [Methylobacterium sp. 391_Methyba4]
MIGPRAGRTRRFRAARGGNVAILVALGSAMLMGAGAVGIDLGMVFQARRKAQGAVDIAAMLAAVDPAQADTAARRSLGDNGYATATATVSPGRYDASAPGTAPGSRFKAGGSPANAVRVGLSTSVPVTFGRAIGLPAAVPLRVTGTAASAQFAAFTIGSGTLQLQGGIANALLGALLGAKLSLSVSDYDALASARVDGLRVLDALGASLNMQAANYTDIVQAQASVGQMLMALRVAAQDNGSVVSALSGILNALPNAGNLIAIGQVDGLGDAAALAPPRGFAGPSLNVLNLLGAAAALANGQNQVAVDLGATIPGLLATRLTLAIGERKRSSGWVRPGSPNATVQTAQTRLLIEATVTAPLGLGSLTLPVYAEVAPAQATLRALTCAGPSGRQVTLDAQTGLATLAIAGVPRTAINGGSTGPDLSQPAPLIALPLITVSGRALVTLGTGAQTLTFSEADIANHTVRSVASGNLTQSLTGSLLRNLTLNINGIGVAPLLQSALTTTLGAVAPAIDLVLDNVLRSLGLRLGYADLDVDGTLCSQAVLVQ